MPPGWNLWKELSLPLVGLGMLGEIKLYLLLFSMLASMGACAGQDFIILDTHGLLLAPSGALIAIPTY